MRVTILAGLLMLGVFQVVLADPYYTGTTYTPYPPGCATVPLQQAELYGDNIARIFSGRVWLDVVHKLPRSNPFDNRGQVDLTLFRVGCSEPDRSVILLEFRLPEAWVDPRLSQFVLPSVGGDGTAMQIVPFELRSEPNGWGENLEQNALSSRSFGDYTDGWDDARRFTWRYVLDVGPAGRYWDTEFLTGYYNRSFPLVFFAEDGSELFMIDVPATRDVLTANPDLPLNGRLSGIWVEEGTTDQGFVLSFSNPVPPAGVEMAQPEWSDLIVFLSWYTFDHEGNQLWLTGAGRFPQADSEVSVPLDRVVNGQFLGNQNAERFPVGSLRLKAVQCNELQVDYDLAALGMGTGDFRLQRLYALEIAGYPCRDYTARLNSLAVQSDN